MAGNQILQEGLPVSAGFKPRLRSARSIHA
jgi:hypothetical protein